jgi:uncharacterized protein
VLDSIPLIDAHVHTARLPTLKMSLDEWTGHFEGGVEKLLKLYDDEGTMIPARFDEYMAEEGVDVAILFAEYSPKSTGIQAVEDMLPILDHDPARFRLMANLNLHYPLVEELKRQISLGAVGLKLHPVHGSFTPNDRMLYPAYAFCESERFPVAFHCGTSVFPGATNRYADPALIEDVARDFPDLPVVLAHGGRGWWYDAAAFITLMRPNVHIEISGLPPKKLPDYYSNFDLERLARKMIFGTDWPGVPGPRANAQAIASLGLERDTLVKVLHENARRIYKLKRKEDPTMGPHGAGSS